MTMSHTHAGPGILSRQETFTSLPGGHFIGPYLDAVVAACVDASRQAVDALEPAWIRDANSGARGATLLVAPLAAFQPDDSHPLPTSHFSLHLHAI